MASNTTPHLDKPLVLEFQPNQLITITQLDINLTSKNKALTSRLIFLSFVLFIFATSEHKVDTIPICTAELHVYNHLDPIAQSSGCGDLGVVATMTSGGALMAAGGGMRWSYAFAPACDPCLLPTG